MKDMIDFTQDLISGLNDLQSVFTKFFDQHVAMYYLSSRYPVSVSSEINGTTIRYIVKPNKVEELRIICQGMSTPVSVSDKTYYPEFDIIGDNLYVTLRDTRAT